MPTAVKTIANMTKHLTQAEIEARQTAEAGVLPERQTIRLQRPPFLASIPGAGLYWTRTLKRMEGLDILDDLDSETLGVYCVTLARYKTQCQRLKAVERSGDEDGELAGEIRMEMARLEKTILGYAERLGLTPSGRMRLARKRAAAAEAEANADLFGDDA